MNRQQSSRQDRLLILIPVYEDWNALAVLLPALDQELNVGGLSADILVVDDGSSECEFVATAPKCFRSIETIDILSLRRNVGHQRAIAVGLSYLEANQLCHLVVVMDCDGQDDPRDIPRLVKECSAHQDQKIIFAARTRRAESLPFKLFYHLYRLIHFLLTGIQVRVGNFSVIPVGILRRLVAVSELWNHYAAAVYKAKLPIALIPTKRNCRLEGSSRMNLISLVVHGLSAMAVFGDRIGVRLLVVVSIGMSLLSGALITVIAIRLLTSLAIPGWATYVAGLLLVILIQMLIVVLVFAFVILAGRDTVSIIPSRDYVHITDAVRRVYGSSP
jgi:glycosyltransferase involved in cell wall biosynthesis